MLFYELNLWFMVWLQVGGEFTDTVIRGHMAQLGRVAICGSISTYNAVEPFKGAYYPLETFF